jgi:hypothetical protein
MYRCALGAEKLADLAQVIRALRTQLGTIQHLLPLDWAEATRDSISGGFGWLLRASR